jgi:hypothetical protein
MDGAPYRAIEGGSVSSPPATHAIPPVAELGAWRNQDSTRSASPRDGFQGSAGTPPLGSLEDGINFGSNTSPEVTSA